MQIKPSLTSQIVKHKGTYQTKGMDFKKQTDAQECVHSQQKTKHTSLAFPVPKTHRHVLGETFLHSTFLLSSHGPPTSNITSMHWPSMYPMIWNPILLYVAQHCYLTVTHSYNATGNSASRRTLGSIWGCLCTTSKEKAA